MLICDNVHISTRDTTTDRKIPARTVARRFGHFDLLINGTADLAVAGSVPSYFRDRRSPRNARQRRLDSRGYRAFRRTEAEGRLAYADIPF